MVDSAERCFFVVKKVMFAVDEYKFKVHEHMFADGEYKYTEHEYKIEIVLGKFRVTGIFRCGMPANNARFL